MLIELLREAFADSNKRAERIKRFQQLVWETSEHEIAPSERRIWDILDELAVDLDYYEPNEAWRRESPSLLGEEELRQLIIVIFVHGSNADSKVFDKSFLSAVKQTLGAKGHVLFDWSGTMYNVMENDAHRFCEFVKQVKEKHPLEPIIVVAKGCEERKPNIQYGGFPNRSYL
ncbi:MAG: hypothetical protein KatS3mg017_0639 [Fimbriimonadales bacterium]|nr:MAG: hypothetical protein KatS3mg017_0639 [Fimbriimonadales bacterium]